MTNNQAALPGTTPFSAMGIDSSPSGLGGPPVYQHFTGPCSIFINHNVFRQPGNYSIEMAFHRGSETNFGQAPPPQQTPQAMATRGRPTHKPKPRHVISNIHPQILNVQAEAAPPPYSPASFAPAQSHAPGQQTFPEGPHNGERVLRLRGGNGDHSN